MKYQILDAIDTTFTIEKQSMATISQSPLILKNKSIANKLNESFNGLLFPKAKF